MRTKDAEKKARIYRATLSLFASHGLSGMTVAGIARAAGVASGTIYLYFSSKEALLNALYHKLKRESGFSAPEVKAGASVKSQLQQLWAATLEYRIGNPEEVQFLEQFSISPMITPENKSFQNGFNDHVKELLRLGQEQGSIRRVSVDHLFLLLSGFARDFSRNKVVSGETVTDREKAATFDLAWQAMRHS